MRNQVVDVDMLSGVFWSNLHLEKPERCSKIAKNELQPNIGLVLLTFPECSVRVFAWAGANQWAECCSVLCSTTAAPNDVLTIHILTGLWHFYGDTRWEPTPHTMMQNLMPHNILSSLHSNHILKTAIKQHSGAPGSILKILCILKLPNKKEKFVFIIQNSFQLSRRDCEVFNKQNSAAAWGREGIPPLCYIPTTREQKETENCSRGRGSSVHRTNCRD